MYCENCGHRIPKDGRCTNCRMYTPPPDVYEAEKQKIWQAHLAHKRAIGKGGPHEPAIRECGSDFYEDDRNEHN